MAVYKLIKLKRDYAANWTLLNPILSLAEPGYERDTGKLKIGDGVTPWVDLDYIKVDMDDVVIDPDDLADVLNDVLVGGYGIQIVYSDPSDQILIQTTGLASESDLIALSGEVANLDSALIFRGVVDPTQPNSAPTNPAPQNGDLWISNADGPVDTSWVPLTGQPVVQDQFLLYEDGVNGWVLGGSTVGVDLSDYVTQDEFAIWAGRINQNMAAIQILQNDMNQVKQDISTNTNVNNTQQTQIDALIQATGHIHDQDIYNLQNADIVLSDRITAVSGHSDNRDDNLQAQINALSGNGGSVPTGITEDISYLSGLINDNTNSGVLNHQDIVTLSGLIDGGLDFKGYIDPTATGSAPASQINGDLWVSDTSGVIDNGWTCIAGDSIGVNQWMIYSDDDNCWQLGPATDIDLSAYALKTELNALSGLVDQNATGIVVISGLIGSGIPSGLVEYSTGLAIRHGNTEVSVNEVSGNSVIDLTNWKIKDGHFIPNSNANFDLGNAEYKVRHLFLSDNSIYMGEGNLSATSGSTVLLWNGEPLAQVSDINSALTGLKLLELEDVTSDGPVEEYAVPVYNQGTTEYKVKRLTPLEVEDTSTPPLGGYPVGSLGNELQDIKGDIQSNTILISGIAEDIVEIPDAVIFKGVTDPTVSGSAPAGPDNGDMWVSNNSGLIDGSWTGLSGEDVVQNQFLLYSTGLSVWLRGGKIDVNDLSDQYLPLTGNLNPNDQKLDAVEFTSNVVTTSISGLHPHDYPSMGIPGLVGNLTYVNHPSQPSATSAQVYGPSEFNIDRSDYAGDWKNGVSYGYDCISIGYQNEDTPEAGYSWSIQVGPPSKYFPSGVYNNGNPYQQYRNRDPNPKGWNPAFIAQRAAVRGQGAFEFRPLMMTTSQDMTTAPYQVGFKSCPQNDIEFYKVYAKDPSSTPTYIGFHSNPRQQVFAGPSGSSTKGYALHVDFKAGEEYELFQGTGHGRVYGFFADMSNKGGASVAGFIERNAEFNQLQAPTVFGADTIYGGSNPFDPANIYKPTDQIDIAQGGLRIRNAKLVQESTDGNPGQIGWDQNGLLCYTSSSWKRAPLLRFTTTVTNPDANTLAFLNDGEEQGRFAQYGYFLIGTKTSFSGAGSVPPCKTTIMTSGLKRGIARWTHMGANGSAHSDLFLECDGDNQKVTFHSNNQVTLRHSDSTAYIPSDPDSLVTLGSITSGLLPIEATLPISSADDRVTLSSPSGGMFKLTADSKDKLQVTEDDVVVYQTRGNTNVMTFQADRSSGNTAQNCQFRYISSYADKPDGYFGWFGSKGYWRFSSSETAGTDTITIDPKNDRIGFAQTNNNDVFLNSPTGNVFTITMGSSNNPVEKFRITADDIQMFSGYVPLTDQSLVTKGSMEDGTVSARLPISSVDGTVTLASPSANTFNISTNGLEQVIVDEDGDFILNTPTSGTVRTSVISSLESKDNPQHAALRFRGKSIHLTANDFRPNIAVEGYDIDIRTDQGKMRIRNEDSTIGTFASLRLDVNNNSNATKLEFATGNVSRAEIKMPASNGNLTFTKTIDGNSNGGFEFVGGAWYQNHTTFFNRFDKTVISTFKQASGTYADRLVIRDYGGIGLNMTPATNVLLDGTTDQAFVYRFKSTNTGLYDGRFGTRIESTEYTNFIVETVVDPQQQIYGLWGGNSGGSSPIIAGSQTADVLIRSTGPVADQFISFDLPNILAPSGYIPSEDNSLVTRDFLTIQNLDDVEFPVGPSPVSADQILRYSTLNNKWVNSNAGNAVLGSAPLGGWPVGSVGEAIANGAGAATLPISSVDGTVRLDGASNVLSVSGAVSSDTGSSTPFRAISSTDSAYYKSTASANGGSEYWAGAVSTASTKDYRIANGAAAVDTVLLVNEKHGLDYATGGAVPVTRLFSQDHDSTQAGSFLVDYHGRLYASSTKTSSNSVARNSAVSTYAKVETGNTRVGYSLRATYWGDTTVSPDYPFQGVSYLYGFYSNPVIRDIRVGSCFDFSAVGPQSINSSGTVGNIAGFMVASTYGSQAIPPSGQEKVIKYGMRSDLAADIGSDGNHKAFNFFVNGTAPSRFVGNVELANSRLRSSSATSNELFFSGNATVHEGARIIMRPRPGSIDPNDPTDGQYYLQLDQPRDPGAYAYRIYQYPSGQSTPLASAGYGATVMYTNNTTLGILGGSGINFNGDANSLYGYGYQYAMLAIKPDGDLQVPSVYTPLTDNSLVDKKALQGNSVSTSGYWFENRGQAEIQPGAGTGENAVIPVNTNAVFSANDYMLNDGFVYNLHLGTASTSSSAAGEWIIKKNGSGTDDWVALPLSTVGATSNVPMLMIRPTTQIDPNTSQPYASRHEVILYNNHDVTPYTHSWNVQAYVTSSKDTRYSVNTAFATSGNALRPAEPLTQYVQVPSLTSTAGSPRGDQAELTWNTADGGMELRTWKVDQNAVIRARNAGLPSNAPIMRFGNQRNGLGTFGGGYLYMSQNTEYDATTNDAWSFTRSTSPTVAGSCVISPMRGFNEGTVGGGVFTYPNVSGLAAAGGAFDNETVHIQDFAKALTWGQNGQVAVGQSVTTNAQLYVNGPYQNNVLSITRDSTSRSAVHVLPPASQQSVAGGIIWQDRDKELYECVDVGGSGNQADFEWQVVDRDAKVAGTGEFVYQGTGPVNAFFAQLRFASDFDEGGSSWQKGLYVVNPAPAPGGNQDWRLGKYAGIMVENCTFSKKASSIVLYQNTTSDASTDFYAINSVGTAPSYHRGKLGIGAGGNNPQFDLDIQGDRIALRQSYIPGALSAGTVGEISWSDDYIWVRTTAGWKKSALDTFNGNGSSSSVVRGSVAATGTQTDFTVTEGYTPNQLDVYVNGVKMLDTTDYTATNGSTIVLATPAASGDIVQYTAYSNVSVTLATQAGTPLSSSDAGSIGDIKHSDHYIWVKTSAGWKKSPLYAFNQTPSLTVRVTQAEYDALTPDSDITYVIVG